MMSFVCPKQILRDFFHVFVSERTNHFKLNTTTQPLSIFGRIFSSNATLTMIKIPTLLFTLALLFSGASALALNKAPCARKPAFDSKRAAFNGIAVASLTSALVVGPMADAMEMVAAAPSFGSSSLIAERVTREGLYREYDVDLGDQQFDDARSTYKSAKETKTKKGM